MPSLKTKKCGFALFIKEEFGFGVSCHAKGGRNLTSYFFRPSFPYKYEGKIEVYVNGFMKFYHNTWQEISRLRAIDKLFYIYLLSKQNQFGDKAFFLTDKCIMSDLALSRMSLYRIKKRIILLPFITYEPGKYRKSVSKWYISGINLIHKAYQNGATSNMDSKMDKKKGDFSQNPQTPEVHIHNTIVNNPPPKDKEKLDLGRMGVETKDFLKGL